MRRDIIAVISDTHIGSTWAVCPPTVALDDGGTYKQSSVQGWLWQSWVNFFSQVRDVRPRGGGKKYLIHLGDIIEGDHHDTSQIITRNPATMQNIAIDVLEPICKWADVRFFLRGTGAHAGKSAWIEEAIADDLGGERDEGRDTASWWHLRLDVNGYVIDAAHHPPSGTSREWLRHGPAATLAAKVWWQYMESGDKPPDLAVRGHRHRWGDSSDTYQTRGILLPCWKASDEYVSRLAAEALPHVGGLFGIIEDGRAEWRKIKYELPRRAAWKDNGHSQ